MSTGLDREVLQTLPIAVVDVSSDTAPEPKIEVHRLLPQCLPSGLRITACGIEQESIGHGWFYLDNLYQFSRIADGSWPVCGECLPGTKR